MEFKWDLLRWWRKIFVRKKLPVPRANLSRPMLQLAHGQHKAWPTELQANQLSLLPDAFSKKDARADQATRFFQYRQMPQVATWSGKECSLMCASTPGKLKLVT